MNTQPSPTPPDVQLVGGCSGLYLVPSNQVADFYRAHLIAAIAGVLMLLAYATQWM